MNGKLYVGGGASVSQIPVPVRSHGAASAAQLPSYSRVSPSPPADPRPPMQTLPPYPSSAPTQNLPPYSSPAPPRFSPQAFQQNPMHGYAQQPKSASFSSDPSLQSSSSPRRLYHRKCFWLILVVLLVAAAAVTTILLVSSNKGKKSSATPAPMSAQNYTLALQQGLLFFDAQKSGPLPRPNKRVAWRGPSGLTDGKEAGVDLVGGYYDSGDNVKFGFPMAFTVTMLSWSVLQYRDKMEGAGELAHAMDAIKWGTDYFLKAHPSPNVLYIQVGNAKADHNCWERPEVMTTSRQVTQVNVTHPGADVAAETAAALAAASLVFNASNAAYAKLLLSHSVELFQFAQAYPGLYSQSVPEVRGFYNSSDSRDELLWAATWLAKASGDATYASFVTSDTWIGLPNPTKFGWNDKTAGALVLAGDLAAASSDAVGADAGVLAQYRNSAEKYLCLFVEGGSRTPGGLLWLAAWSPIQYAVSIAFLVYAASLEARDAKMKCGSSEHSPADLNNFAQQQADYILGDNPRKMSYMVGYSSAYPTHVHHRGASTPASGTKYNCVTGWQWLNAAGPNPNRLTGALVGGPSDKDVFTDARDNFQQNEVSTYLNAPWIGLVASLI
eukprot:jgi/Mesen1/4325/ME000022S03613